MNKQNTKCKTLKCIIKKILTKELCFCKINLKKAGSTYHILTWRW